ncbi:MAG: hypothetical protein ABSC94_12830 [Polyangiaceae bacterium]|jgi:hypothetical protein
MTRALAQPALQVLGAICTLIVFTWPFLAFDRPVVVVVYFFVAWCGVIGLLFAFSRAREDMGEDDATGGFELPIDQDDDA